VFGLDAILYEALRDRPQAAVGVLGGTGKHIKRLRRVELVTLHQHPLRLANDRPGGESAVKLLELLRGAQRNRDVRGQSKSDVALLIVEGIDAGGVEVQSADAVVGDADELCPIRRLMDAQKMPSPANPAAAVSKPTHGVPA
jgi:hypothetical protein